MFLNELQCFITAAEHLNFTTAAKHLFITQSGLSKLIDKMEKDLGIKAFVRENHKIELTHVGKEFLMAARSFLMECHRLQFMPTKNTEASKTLTLAISSHYGHYGHIYVNKFLELIKNEISEADLTVLNLPISDINEKLQCDELDFAIIVETGLACQKDINYQILERRSRKIVLSKSNPLSSYSKLRLSDLRTEKFITIERGQSPVSIDMIITLCTSCGFYPKIIKQVQNFDTLYMLINNGQGLTISAVKPDENMYPDLVTVDIDESEYPDISRLNNIYSDIIIAWKNSAMSPLSENIIKALQVSLKS